MRHNHTIAKFQHRGCLEHTGWGAVWGSGLTQGKELGAPAGWEEAHKYLETRLEVPFLLCKSFPLLLTLW